MNIRQISNYPGRPLLDGTENVLLQVGGLGGPYQYTTTADLVASALSNPSLGAHANIGVGQYPPPDAWGGNVICQNLDLPNWGAMLWNSYVSQYGVVRFLNSGQAARLGWSQPDGLHVDTTTVGNPGDQVPAFMRLMTLSNTGNLQLPCGTLTVARDPATPQDVATAGWVGANTVANFNGRQGQVTLTPNDIYLALGLCSPIATEQSVASTLQTGLTEFLNTQPLVFSWNGRTGMVDLTLSDIMTVFFYGSSLPATPTPPAFSYDLSIANTYWVSNEIATALANLAAISTANVAVGATPPTNPQPGWLWWDTTDGNLYVWYDDGTSQQWVSAMADGSGGGGSPGGPFLPLSGGMVTGNIEAMRASYGTQHGSAALFDGSTPLLVTDNPTYTAASGEAFRVNGAYGGTITETGQPRFNLFLANDGVKAPNANSVTNVANYYTVSGGSIGPRIAQQISFNITGNTADPANNWAFFQGLAVAAEINATTGGTSGNPAGSITGANIIASLGPNGHFSRGCLGVEIDVAVQAGAGAPVSKGGLLIALQGADAVDSSTASIALGIGLSPDSPSSPGFMHGIAFGSAGGWWPINPTSGVLIYADPLDAGGTGRPAHTAATGIDFSAVTFSSNFLKSAGFTVDGTGRITTNGGMTFGNNVAGSTTDNSKHIELYGTNYGINITGGFINFVVSGSNTFSVTGTGAQVNGSLASGGLDLGSVNAASTTDTSKHITLYDGASGINVYSGQTNFVMNTPAWIWRDTANNQYAYIASGGIVSVKGLSVWNGTPPASKPTVTGAKGSNAALASLLAALVSYGLVTDSSTA